MKVLIGGVFNKSSTERLCVRAFRALGVKVEVVDYYKYFHISFLNKVLNKLRATPHYFGTKHLNESLICAARQFSPDFVLLFKPIFITPKTVVELKSLTKVFSWYPDYVLFPKTCSTNFYKSIPLYDCHFSFNFANSEEIKKLGAKRSFFVPCAADTFYHHPVVVSQEEKKKIGADIVFIGTYAKEKRSEYLERLCKDGYDIKIYGNDWKKHPKDSCLFKKGCIQFKEMCGGDMSRVFSASKIALSFVRDHNDELLACRTFEIPACGAFMLHQRTAKIGEFLEEKKEADFFSTYNELKRKIDFYLKNEAVRENIAKKGRERVLRDGLFMNRIQYVIEVFSGLS